MAGSDYTLKIIINAEDRAGGQLRGIRRTLESLQSGLRTVGVAALGGLGILAGAAGTAGIALGRLAVDAAPIANIRDAFDGLADSAGRSGDEILAALQKASGGMVAQRDLMQSFNLAAQLVSEDFAVNLPEAMQYLGKVSAATGQDMNFLLDSLVRGVGRMSPMILDNLGIQVELSEATERAAQMFGIQAEELTEAQVQAGLAAVVMDKLRENTEALPDPTQTAAGQMAQLRARLADLKDNIGMALLPAFTSLLDTLGRVADEVLPRLAGFIGDTLVPALERGVEFVGLFVDKLLSGQDPLSALQATLAEMGLDQIAEAIGTVAGKVQEFWTAAQPVVDQIISWVQNNVELKDVLTALGIAIAAVVIPALAAILEPIAIAVGAFMLVLGAVTALRHAWESNFLGIRDITQSVLSFIQNLISTVLGWIQEFWAAHGEQIIAAAQRAWEMIQSLFEAFSAAFRGDWRGFGEKLREYWDEAWENIRKIGEETWDAIKTFFSETDWGAVGRAIIDGIASGISSAAGKIADAAKRAARAALDAARGFLGIHSPSAVFADVGRQMMAGMAEGIRAGISLPEAQLQSVAGRTAQTASGSWQAVTIHHLTIEAASGDDLLRQLRALSAAGGAA